MSNTDKSISDFIEKADNFDSLMRICGYWEESDTVKFYTKAVSLVNEISEAMRLHRETSRFPEIHEQAFAKALELSTKKEDLDEIYCSFRGYGSVLDFREELAKIIERAVELGLIA